MEVGDVQNRGRLPLRRRGIEPLTCAGTHIAIRRAVRVIYVYESNKQV